MATISPNFTTEAPAPASPPSTSPADALLLQIVTEEVARSAQMSAAMEDMRVGMATHQKLLIMLADQGLTSEEKTDRAATIVLTESTESCNDSPRGWGGDTSANTRPTARPAKQVLRPTTTREYLNLSQSARDTEDMDDTCEPRIHRQTANTPAISDFLHLDAAGEFVESDHPLSLSVPRINESKSSLSYKLEDDIMDRKKRISFKEISSAEKRAVFQLSAVRRSMRHLQHANIIMQQECMDLSTKYMEIGPSRASLAHIGYESLQVRHTGRTARKQTKHGK